MHKVRVSQFPDRELEVDDAELRDLEQQGLLVDGKGRRVDREGRPIGGAAPVTPARAPSPRAPRRRSTSARSASTAAEPEAAPTPDPTKEG